MNNKLKYIVLALFLGIICKIYDDLSDNNLYSHFEISDEKKPYVDDTMKGLFIIGFTILSIENPMFLISFTTINLLFYFKKKEDFTSYDFSGFISPIILLPFLKWNNINDYKKIILWICLVVLAAWIVEKSGPAVNGEYSIKKMTSRCTALFMTILAIMLSSYLDIPTSVLQMYYFGAGYVFISSITQYCLVNGIWKNDDVINLEDKMSNKDSNSEIIEEEE